MTANQIAYFSYKENKRHNLETEAFNISQLDEVRRHNLAYESETQRHNLANESYQIMSLAEAKRHNIATETQQSNLLTETIRHNTMTENELLRSNTARENETFRSNVARESETQRSNKAKESETQRHNLETESSARDANKIHGIQTVGNLLLGAVDAVDDWRKTTSQIKVADSQEKVNRSTVDKNAANTFGTIVEGISKLGAAVKAVSSVAALLGA